MENNTKPVALRHAAGQQLMRRLADEYAAQKRRADVRHYTIAAIVLAALAATFLAAADTGTANTRPSNKAQVAQATHIIDNIIQKV